MIQLCSWGFSTAMSSFWVDATAVKCDSKTHNSKMLNVPDLIYN